MASSIDPTKPTEGSALTSDVRANFSAAKTEIEALQTDKAALADLAPTATDDGTKGFHLVSYPPKTGEIGIENYEYDYTDSFRFIPKNLHASILDGTINTDLVTYIDNMVTSIGATSGTEEIMEFKYGGTYTVASPIRVSNSYKFGGDGTIKAMSGFTGITLNNINLGGTYTFKSVFLYMRTDDAWDISGPRRFKAYMGDNLNIDCNSQADNGVFMERMPRSYIGCNVENAVEEGIYLGFYNWGTKLNHNILMNNETAGIVLDKASNGVSISDIYVKHETTSTTFGVKLAFNGDSNGVQISGGVIESCDYGVYSDIRNGPCHVVGVDFEQIIYNDVYVVGDLASPTNRLIGPTTVEDCYLETKDYVISSITQANPAVVTTAVAHTFSNGDTVYLSDVVGMIEVSNRKFTVANKTSTTFELQGENSTGYTAFTSGDAAHGAKIFADRGRVHVSGCRGRPGADFETSDTNISGITVDNFETENSEPQVIRKSNVIIERHTSTALKQVHVVPSRSASATNSYNNVIRQFKDNTELESSGLDSKGTFVGGATDRYISSWHLWTTKFEFITDPHALQETVGLDFQPFSTSTSGGELVPSSDDTINLGSAAKRFKVLHASYGINPGDFTDTQLNDITHSVNTTNKTTGKAVFNTTQAIWIYAAGATAGSVWKKMSDDTTANTPV